MNFQFSIRVPVDKKEDYFSNKNKGNFESTQNQAKPKETKVPEYYGENATKFWMACSLGKSRDSGGHCRNLTFLPVGPNERNALANRMHSLKFFDFKEQKQWVRTLSDGSRIVTSVPDVKLLFKMNGGGFNVEWLPRDLTLMEQENPLALSLTSGQLLTEWSVHYLVDIQSKYKPYLLRDSAGKEYFDQVAFLQSLDLEYDKEVLPISMNSFMLEKLLNKAIVETVGVLIGESTSETLRLFANNAFNQYKTRNIGLKAGKFLTDVQISLLEDPIIWPVFTNCWSSSTVIPCLSYQIYFNNRLIEEIVDDATGLVLSGRVLDLRTDQLVIPWLVKLKGSEQVKLSVDSHVVILGSLEGHDVNAEIKGELINLGKVKSTKDIAINAARIFLTNKVQAGEKLSIYAVEDLLIETLSELASVTSPYLGYRSTEQKVTVKATIEAGIDATLKSGKNTLITGAKIIGNKVLLQSNGKTAIVPLELYLEVIKWGHKFYYEYQRVTPVLTEITCGNGNCDIESQDDITVIGPNIQGKGEATWKSINGAVNVEAASIKEKSFQVTQGKKGLFGKTKRTEKTFFETPVQSTINFIGTFFTSSYESQRWIGIHIKAKQVHLNAGTPEHVAHISMLPSYKMAEIEVHTRSKSFKLGFEKGGVTFAEVVRSGNAKKFATPFPTIIQVEEELVVYAQGKFLYLQPHIDYIKETDEKGKIKIIVNAKDIELERAPEIEAEYIYHNKAGNGVGFKAKGGEFAIKSSVYHEQSKESWLKIRHPIAPIVRGFVEFNGDTIKDAGIYYFAEEMNLHSKIEVHTVVSDVETRKRVDSLFEAGMKFGIRSNVVSIKNTAKGITKDDHGSVEGVISSAFRGWKLYHDVLKLFSSNANFGISGGLWFFVHGEYSKSESRAVTEIPSILNVTKLNSTSDELSFKGTQVTAYELYIKTKYAKSDAAKSTYDASSKRGSFDLDIPVYGNIPASLSAEISKGKVKIEKNLRTQIYVSGRCKLDVSIRADLKGFFLSARELEANFNDLVLESLQDIIESKAWGAGVGVGLDGKDMPKLDNIKGSLQDRNRHVVESLSEILGSDPEKTKIVVANALRLNGAIVANAEKDENGNYTDHGNLVLTVGYLFIKHIYDHDSGKTLSASFSMGSDIKLHDQKGKDIPFMSLEATLAGHDKDGWTYATIGKSNKVTITGNPEELEKANRDLSKVQTWNTNYDIKEIFLYYSNIDTKALKAGIPDTPEAWVKGVSQYVKSTLLPNSQSNVVLTEEQLEAIKAKAEENIQKLKNKAKNLSKKDKTEITEHNEKQISEVNKVKQELDHIQNDYASGKITEKSAKTKILENTAELIRNTGAKYVEFAEKHPTLAEYGLSGLNIAVQTAIGSIAGFINSIKSEALGRAIGASIGESISSLINGRVAEAATIIKNTNPELDEGDATSLATGLVLGGILVAFGTMGAKQLLKDLSKIKVPNSILKSVMSSITHEQKAVFDSLKNIKISPNILAQKVKGSQLFKRHFNGKPAKLDVHEGRSHDGHTLSKHVSTGNVEKDVQFLVKRNMNNPLPDGISSMYQSKEVAEKVTNEVLLHNEASILKWFKNKRDNSGVPFYMEFKDKIGYGVIKGDNKLEFFNIARVYLRKKGESIKIETSFPVREAKR